MSLSQPPFSLALGFQFEDLYRREGLARLDAAFLNQLQATEIELFNRLMEGRANPAALARREYSELVIDLAPHLEDFLGELFGIQREVTELQGRHHALAPLYAFKRKFIVKRAISGVTREQAAAWDGSALARELEELFGEPLTEGSFVRHVSRWLEEEPAHSSQIQTAQRYAAWACLSSCGLRKHCNGVLFRVPHKLDMHHLVPVETVEVEGVARMALPKKEWRQREAFHLTDPGMDLVGALDQANYCI